MVRCDLGLLFPWRSLPAEMQTRSSRPVLAVMPGYEPYLPVLNRGIYLFSRLIIDMYSCIVPLNYLGIVFFSDRPQSISSFFLIFSYFFFKSYVFIVGQRDIWSFIVYSPLGSIVYFPLILTKLLLQPSTTFSHELSGFSACLKVLSQHTAHPFVPSLMYHSAPSVLFLSHLKVPTPFPQIP